MNRKRIATVGLLGLSVLAVVAASGAPTQSRPDLASRARAFGMPADGRLAAASQYDGELIIVWYYDSAGKLQKIGDEPVEPTPPPGR